MSPVITTWHDGDEQESRLDFEVDGASYRLLVTLAESTDHPTWTLSLHSPGDGRGGGSVRVVGSITTASRMVGSAPALDTRDVAATMRPFILGEPTRLQEAGDGLATPRRFPVAGAPGRGEIRVNRIDETCWEVAVPIAGVGVSDELVFLALLPWRPPGWVGAPSLDHVLAAMGAALLQRPRIVELHRRGRERFYVAPLALGGELWPLLIERPLLAATAWEILLVDWSVLRLSIEELFAYFAKGARLVLAPGYHAVVVATPPSGVAPLNADDVCAIATALWLRPEPGTDSKPISQTSEPLLGDGWQMRLEASLSMSHWRGGPRFEAAFEAFLARRREHGA